ncbi:MAG TPA: PLP-dependent aminotransferase family protein [Thermodesulfovibrionales bacterium]|nr:PLP-dependent aminotransferase family protein [Thermodesulfovibrionales bacterium]
MYAERIGGLKSSAIRDILEVTSRPGMISFAGGLPAPELFPVEQIKEVSQRVLSEYGSSALQYSITEGLLSLRNWIAGEVSPDLGPVGSENIIITQGSQQGLDLVSKLFLDKGSTVFVENPSYLGALQSFQLFQANVIAIPSDEQGMQMSALRERLKTRKPAFMYLMPNFQNPTGVSLSMERRLMLAEIVNEHNLRVIEDNPYGQLVYEGLSHPSLYGLAGTGNFIYLSTFSKTIAPGLRVAYVVADREVIRKLALVKQGTDLQTNTFGQHLVYEYVRSGGYEAHISLLRETYRHRRDCMISALESHFPESVTWNRPEGGMFLWLTLPEGSDTNDILPHCLEQDVAFVPGHPFFPDGSGRNTMRLNFSNATPHTIKEGIRRMGEVLKRLGI